MIIEAHTSYKLQSVNDRTYDTWNSVAVFSPECLKGEVLFDKSGVY